MKITKSFTVICYLCLLAISIANVSSTNTRSTIKSRALSKTKIDLTWARRIISGVGNALLGANKSLQDNFLKVIGCFKGKATTAKKNSVDQKSYELTDSIINGLVRGVKFIFSFPKAIMGYLCKFKRNIAVYISQLFSMRRLRKYRRMMENGQSLSLSQLRAYKSAWSFKGALKSAGSFLKKGASFAWKGVKYIGGKAWKLAAKIILPFIKKNFEKIKALLVVLRDSFFSKDSFLGKLVDCSKQLGKKFLDAVKGFWNKLKAKYAAYKGIYGLGAPYVALSGFDLLFEAVCNKVVVKELVTASNKVLDSQKKKDSREQTIQGGYILGTSVKFLEKAKSNVQDIINAALKKQKKKN